MLPSAHGRSSLPTPRRHHRPSLLRRKRRRQGADRGVRHAGAVSGGAHRHNRRRRRPSPLRHQEQPRAARPLPQRHPRADAGVGQRRAPPDGAGAMLCRPARHPEQHRAGRRAARALRPLLTPRLERRAHRDAHQAHALGGAALAHPFHGATGADEHRRLRGLLLRGVHRRLSRHGPFHGAAAAAHGADRPRAYRGAGHRPALLDSRHSGGRLLRRSQHPRRRDVHQPGARLGGGHPDRQHPEPQPRHRVRRHSLRVLRRQDRQRRRQPSAPSWSRSWTPTPGRATSANSPWGSTRAS